MLPRLNPVLPFEDQSSLEFLAEKNDASLMLVGSHSKKRPHNLVMARFFDFKVLDMIELGVTGFTSAASLKVRPREGLRLQSVQYSHNGLESELVV